MIILDPISLAEHASHMTCLPFPPLRSTHTHTRWLYSTGYTGEIGIKKIKRAKEEREKNERVDGIYQEKREAGSINTPSSSQKKKSARGNKCTEAANVLLSLYVCTHTHTRKAKLSGAWIWG